jgi:hypothetical protein
MEIFKGKSSDNDTTGITFVEHNRYLEPIVHSPVPYPPQKDERPRQQKMWSSSIFWFYAGTYEQEAGRRI